jgi:hypothetical protein
MIHKRGEQWWNDIDRVQPNNSEKNLSLCHVVHNTSQYTYRGENQGRGGKSPATNRLSHQKNKLPSSGLKKQYIPSKH